MNKLQRVKRLRSCDEKEREQMNFTKCSKTFTKSSLDKSSKVWYNIKVAARKCRQQKVMSNTVSWKLNNALQVQKTLEIQESVREDDKKHTLRSQWVTDRIDMDKWKLVDIQLYKEFDPGSGRTLAARLTHASRTVTRSLLLWSVADGWVTREQPAFLRGITFGNER